MNLSGIVRTLNEEEFITSKNVMAGTSDKIQCKIFLHRNGQIVLDDVNVIPAINKIIDELIVNAIDHFVNCIHKATIQHRANSAEPSRYVNMLIFSIDTETGKMAILNTGYGIPIVKFTKENHPESPDYEGLYLPQVLFSKQRTGTNMDADDKRITGGTNGIGATIVTAFSSEMTLDIKDKNYTYIQTMNKKMRTEGKQKVKVSHFDMPIVARNTDPNNQYTKVSFLIDWKSTKYNSFSKNVNSLLTSYIHKRLIQASLYANHVLEVTAKADIPIMKVFLKLTQSTSSQKNGQAGVNTANKPNVIANNAVTVEIGHNINNTDQISALFGLFKCFPVKLNRKKVLVLPSGQKGTVPLSDTINVLIGINDKENLVYREMSIVNGVEVTRNPFMVAIRKYLLASIKSYCIQKNVQLGKKSPKSYFTLVSIMCLPNPQWVGQTKEEIMVSKEIIDSFGIKAACDAIKDKIAEIVYEMIVYNDMHSSTRNRGIKPNTKVYKKCNNLNENHKRIDKNMLHYLILCEGASACSLLNAVVDRGYALNHDNTGFLTTTGVPMNVYHRMNVCSTADFKHVMLAPGEEPRQKLIVDRKLEENQFYEQWCYATGLRDEASDYNKLYSQMNYNYLICATDSDYDGWNITGLFMVLLSKYEGLLDNKHFKILHLPVIRVVPKDLDAITKKEKKRTGKNFLTREFISQIAFREYFSIRDYEEDICINPVPSTHVAKFYKGLATTEDFFKDVIALDIKKYLFTVHADKRFKESLKHYYGKFDVIRDIDGSLITINLADKRKEILREPLRNMTADELTLYNSKFLSVTTYLEVFVKQYFRDNLDRKLPHIMDGQNQVMRKIMFAMFKAIKGNKLAKVSTIAGGISARSGYHHGPASMEGAILNLGQDFFGARLYVPFETSGQWGSIYDGGKNPGTAGSSRYIEAKNDKKFIQLLLRKEDEIILEHQESEGETIEPRFYLPVVPYVILDNYGTAAHGWKCEVWGRCFGSTFTAIFNMIKGLTVSFSTENEQYKTNYDPRDYRLDIDPRNRNDKNDLTFETVINLDKDDNPVDKKTIYYSSGRYRVITGETINGVKRPDIIHIIALPIGVWILDYIERINRKIGIVMSKSDKVQLAEQTKSAGKKSNRDKANLHEKSNSAPEKSNSTLEKSNSTFHDEGAHFAGIVREVVNRNTESVDIAIIMHEGWKEKLNVLVKKDFTEEIDVIETAFMLKVRLVDNLNFICTGNSPFAKDPSFAKGESPLTAKDSLSLATDCSLLENKGAVVSFNSYEEVLYEWFYLRLGFYAKRIERERVILRLRLLIAENKVKYLQLLDNRKDLFGIDKSEFVEILQNHGLCRIREIPYENNMRCNAIPNNQVITFATGEIPPEHELLFKDLIAHRVMAEKLSYKYLTDIPTGRIMRKGIDQLNAHIAELRARLVEYDNPDIIKRTWLTELSEFNKYLQSKN